MVSSDATRFERLTGILQARPEILDGYVFGSEARGEAQAHSDLETCVKRHAVTLGLNARRIAVRDQSSRWGSCSTTGLLSFSWRLILAPAAILDYVAAHEVAHLAEMNHGPRFWALVRRTYPGLDDARRWLHVYGMDLHSYGAETD